MSVKQLLVAKDISEALQVKAFLSSHGINAMVADEHANTIIHYLPGSRVMVQEEDYDKAREKLKTVAFHVVSSDASDTLHASSDLKRQVATDEIEATKKMNRALGASLLGFLGIPLIPSFYSCYLLFKRPRIINAKFFLILFINVAVFCLTYLVVKDLFK